MIYDRVLVTRGDDRAIEVTAVTDGGVDVRAEFRPTPHGTPRCVQINVRLDESRVSADDTLTASLLGRLPLQPLYAAVASCDPLALIIAGLTAVAEVDLRHRPGRRGRPEATYALWAARYVARCHAGSRRPVVELAEEHGVTATAVRRLLNHARERGLLHGSRPGRATGRLTPRALELLATTRVSG